MYRFIFILLPVLLLAAACTAIQQNKLIGMPNPASVHCEEKGGTLTIKKDAEGGEYGICRLPGGRVVEEWTLYREDTRP